MKAKYILLSAFILLMACLLGYYIPKNYPDVGIDTMEYWSAGRLIRSGGNPYSYTEQYKLQKDYWYTESLLPIMMYNPPTAFSFAIGLGLFELKTAIGIWCAFSFLCIVISAFILKYLFFKSSLVRPAFICFAIFMVLYEPIYTQIFYGQCSALFLLAFILSLYFSKKQKIFFAGLCLSVTLLKPHLLFLFYLIWLILLKKEALKAIAGLACGAFIQCIPALIYEPQIFSLYHRSLNAPVWFFTPTLGAWLEYFTDIYTFTIRFLPTFISLLLLFVFYKKIKIYGEKLLIPIILPLSLLSSPYGWSYDQLLALPVLYIFIDSVNQLYINQHKSQAICVLAFFVFIDLFFIIAFAETVRNGQQNAIIFLLIILLMGIASVFIQKKNGSESELEIS